MPRSSLYSSLREQKKSDVQDNFKRNFKTSNSCALIILFISRNTRRNISFANADCRIKFLNHTFKFIHLIGHLIRAISHLYILRYLSSRSTKSHIYLLIHHSISPTKNNAINPISSNLYIYTHIHSKLSIQSTRLAPRFRSTSLFTRRRRRRRPLELCKAVSA